MGGRLSALQFPFKTDFAQDTFRLKYADGVNDTWECLIRRLDESVCGGHHSLMPASDRDELIQYMMKMWFIPAGRYLYYAGRPARFFNNCFALMAEEDTREEWGALANRAMLCLMSGGGIGVEYSKIRPRGRRLNRTGGIASGPLPLMKIINEIGRNVMQGGSRRSAIWAGLNWRHDDAYDFLKVKDWSEDVVALKASDFNFPADLDMTNISIQWDDKFALDSSGWSRDLWRKSVLQMCQTGEPGHSYNFGENYREICRNACTEFISEFDSDVCNLGSVNMGAIDTLAEFRDVVCLASKFLVCGSIRADLPYGKVREVREGARKIGLGLMGIHEWLLKRGYKYEVNDEFKEWLEVYQEESTSAGISHCNYLGISPILRARAVAPAGTIGILASTTTGIEPLFASAYKRRYLTGGTQWKYRYHIDSIAARLCDELGIDEEDLETAQSLAETPERRVAFQAAIQDYVDMGISSTINLPAWGTEFNNEDTARQLSDTLIHYMFGLRGITCYPNGARGGQPLEAVSMKEARKHHGMVYAEENVCSGGVCGI